MTKTVEDDLVARRIVMRREVWDKLADIANALTTPTTAISTTDIASIAIEAGLAVVRKSVGARKPRKRKVAK